MKKFVLFVLLSSISIYGFASNHLGFTQINNIEFEESIEVYINKKGKILADNKKVNIKELDQILKDLKKKKGTLKLAQASLKLNKVQKTNAELSKLINKYKITVELYTDNSFKTLSLQ